MWMEACTILKCILYFKNLGTALLKVSLPRQSRLHLYVVEVKPEGGEWWKGI